MAWDLMMSTSLPVKNKYGEPQIPDGTSDMLSCTDHCTVQACTVRNTSGLSLSLSPVSHTDVLHVWGR